MTTIKATVRGGRLEVEEPINLPDGTELHIPLPDGPAAADDVEDGWDNTPEGIAAWLKWYAALEPLRIAPEEEAEAEAWLKKVNAHGRDALERDTKGLFQ